jgi:hypothetical protein
VTDPRDVDLPPASDPAPPIPAEAATDGIWPYLGVGCLTAVAGLAGGGMIAVLIAKIVGGATGCAVAAETGAPCNWDAYWTWGARIGVVVLPTFAIWRLRRSRTRSRHTD